MKTVSIPIRIILVLGLLGILPAGCGDSGPPLDPIAAATLPYEGEPLDKGTELEGTWHGIEDSLLAGLEFRDEGKVLITNVIMGNTSSALVDYAVVDDGRIEFGAPNGRRDQYTVTTDGSRLELIGGEIMGQTFTQRFRLLPEGQTLAQAITEEKQAKAKLREQQLAQLNSFLQQPHLVLAPAETKPGGLVPMAILRDKTAGGGLQGVAVFDGTPPVRASIQGALANAGYGADRDALPSRLQVKLGQQMGMGMGAQNPGALEGSVPLDIKVEDDKIQLSGSIRLTDGTHYQMELRNDPTLHAAILQHVKDEDARLGALKKDLADQLKDYVVLQGKSASNQAGQMDGTRDNISLRRNTSTDQWQGTVTVTDASGRILVGPEPIQGNISINNDKPELFISSLQRTYSLTADSQRPGVLTGLWLTSPRAVSGYRTELNIVETLADAAITERLQQQRKALTSIPAGTVFQGFVPHWPSQEPSPVALTLNMDSTGQATATAHYPLLMSNVTLKGQIQESDSGPYLELKFADISTTSERPRISPNMFSLQIRNHVWQLRADKLEPTLTLAGNLTLGGRGQFALNQVDAALPEKQRRQFADVLKEGKELLVTRANAGNQPPSNLALQLRDGSQQVTGNFVDTSRRFPGATSANRPVSGTIREKDGWQVLELDIDQPAGSRQQTTTKMELLVREVDGKTVLSGIRYDAHQPAAVENVAVAIK